MDANALPDAIVLDCSVTVPWYLGDEPSGLSAALLEAMYTRTLIVPVLWRLELISAMRSAARRGRVPTERLPKIFAHAAQLPLQQDPLTLDIEEVGRGCLEFGVTPYDFVYLSLARARGLPLATADVALARAARTAGVAVLSDFHEVHEERAPYAVAPVRRAASRKR